MEPRICCCGVKVGAITVAYVQLTLSVVLGLFACVFFGVAANACDDGSVSNDDGCQLIKPMFIVVTIIVLIKTLLILIGAVCVHIGVNRNNPTWLVPLIAINGTMIVLGCFGIIGNLFRGDFIGVCGVGIDLALLCFYTYALNSCTKFMREERATIHTGPAPGFVNIAHQQSPPPYSPTETQYYIQKT